MDNYRNLIFVGLHIRLPFATTCSVQRRLARGRAVGLTIFTPSEDLFGEGGPDGEEKLRAGAGAMVTFPHRVLTLLSDRFRMPFFE